MQVKTMIFIRISQNEAHFTQQNHIYL